MIKVFLREKKLKHGKLGLYLDFYPPIVHPDTNKQTRREHLRLYVYEKPKTEIERDHNKQTRMLGENIKARRQLEFQAGSYGFVPIKNKLKSFLKYFGKITEEKKKLSQSSYENWNSVYKYVEAFTKGECKFADLTPQFCERFKEFLLNSDRLSQNTASNYFDKFKVAVRQAFDDKWLPENPAYRIKSIEILDTQREFLTLEELQTLAKTPFVYEDLRRASLFSALTGLRFSDVEKLIWFEVQHSEEQGYYIRFKQKKTKGAETLPINEDAFSLLGERKPDHSKVFPDLEYWQCAFLPGWTKSAGISRKITFHCFRHTFATLQITLGTDIYTVSKLLGHKNLQTTQIYAKIIDEKKREAVNRIKLK